MLGCLYVWTDVPVVCVISLFVPRLHWLDILIYWCLLVVIRWYLLLRSY